MRRRRLLRAFIVLLLIPLAAGLAAPSVAHAEPGGLEVASIYTYTVDPAVNLVHVQADMTFRNAVPPQTNGNVVNRTYFDGFSIPLPAEAIDPIAVQDGVTLTTRTDPIEGSTTYFRLNVTFADRLFYPETAHVVVTYDIQGQPPRSEAPTRLNAAYAAFNAFGIGDPGQLTVRVVVPPGYEIDTLGADAVQTEEAGNIVYTASNIDQPQDFNLFISARNDAALSQNDVTLEGDAFAVRSWPGDVDWDAFVEQRITTGIPALEALVGREWPVAGSVEIREAFTPYLYGYAGWFDPQSRELEIGEDLDAQTILHELSHAWFNRAWFDERWISEGLAQEYAGLANEQLGEAPVQPDPVDPAAPGALQLNTWMNPDLEQPADETEDYGYNTSWSVMSSILDEVGEDGMRAVFQAADENTVPYIGDVPAEPSSGPHDWRRFLDLVDELGGATTVDELLTTYVLTPEQVALLPERDAARVEYDALETAGGEWAPPLAVRNDMTGWEFADAEELIQQSSAVLDQRSDLEALLATIDVPLVDTAEAAYENTTTDLSSVATLLENEADAANAVITAIESESADRSFLSSVGLYGDNLQPLVDEARAALAAGDFDLAREKADAVRVALDGSDDVGRARLLRVGLGIVALVLVVLAIVLLVRRNRRRRRDQDAAPPATPNETHEETHGETHDETHDETRFAMPDLASAAPLLVMPAGASPNARVASATSQDPTGWMPPPLPDDVVSVEPPVASNGAIQSVAADSDAVDTL